MHADAAQFGGDELSGAAGVGNVLGRGRDGRNAQECLEFFDETGCVALGKCDGGAGCGFHFSLPGLRVQAHQYKLLRAGWIVMLMGLQEMLMGFASVTQDNENEGMSDSSAGFRGQTWDTAAYAATGRFVADLAGGVVELLAPQAGETILDLGCGDGALTEKIAATGAVMTGADGSEAMVTAARVRGLNVHEVRATEMQFDGEFDAVFSNAALHWMPDAEAVLAAVHRALKPGGRFVAEMGGQGNIAAIRVALQAVLRKVWDRCGESGGRVFIRRQRIIGDCWRALDLKCGRLN